MARSFNGSSDKISMATFPVVGSTTAYSIAAWIKPNTVNLIHSILGMDNGGPKRFLQFRISASAKLELVQFTAGESPTGLDGASSLPAATWSHVGCSCPGASGTSKMFVNGVVDGSAAAAGGAPVSVVDQAVIGAQLPSITNNPFPGSIACLAYWSAQIPDSWFAAMAAGALPSLFGPDHFWPLWGMDSPEPDIGMATHVAGTLTGTAFAPTTAQTTRALLELAT